MQVLRKCKRCKEKFDIMSEDYLKIRSMFIHQDCYIESQIKKGISLDATMEAVKTIKQAMLLEQEEKDRVKQEKVKTMVLMQKEKERIRQEKEEKRLLAKKTQVNRVRDRDEFISYITTQYNISVIPKYVYIKLAAINSGTHPNVIHAIPYDDLLDMFKQSEDKLYQIRMQQMTHNNVLGGLNAFNYDLAVLINRYDKYLAWKQKQKTLEVEVVKTVPNLISPTVNINKVVKQVVKKADDDIADILDEFY